MADKPTYPTVSGNAVYSATTLNAIFEDLATAIEGCLGRGGTGESPNSMSGVLDMNTYRIQNLGDPTADQDAATKKWVVDNYGDANVSLAEAARTAAETAQAAAEAAQAAAEASADDVDDLYLGAKSSAPTTDNDGDPIQTGALYYNTTDSKTYVRTSGGTWAEAFSSGTTVPSATTSVEGTVELSLDAEAQAKSGNTVVTCGNLAALDATETSTGFVELASSAEVTAEVGTTIPNVTQVKSMITANATSPGIAEWSLVSTQTISTGAFEVTLTGLDLTTYDYLWVVSSGNFGDNGVVINFEGSDDGGSTWAVDWEGPVNGTNTTGTSIEIAATTTEYLHGGYFLIQETFENMVAVTIRAQTGVNSPSVGVVIDLVNRVGEVPNAIRLDFGSTDRAGEMKLYRRAKVMP